MPPKDPYRAIDGPVPSRPVSYGELVKESPLTADQIHDLFFNTPLPDNASENKAKNILHDNLDEDYDTSSATFASGDDPLSGRRKGAVLTTDATVTTINTIAIVASNTYMLKVKVVARRTGGTAGTADDGATYWKSASYTTKAGTVTLLGAVRNIMTDNEDQAAWDVTFLVSGTNVLIQVTGAINNDITWHSDIVTTKVGS